MKILLNPATGEYIEKKSKFIATVIPIESKQEAEDFVAATKKKYWDARHNCSAYILGENNEIMHSSDDGEPSGTAGRPMLSVLTGNEIHNVAVVVTRYFGGVLLGTGGLVRAYQKAVINALENAKVGEMKPMVEMTAIAEYTDSARVERILSMNSAIKMEGTEYTQNVRFLFLVPVGMEREIREGLISQTNGKVEVITGKTRDEVIGELV